jgi:opacity protein-like surface antigen
LTQWRVTIEGAGVRAKCGFYCRIVVVAITVMVVGRVSPAAAQAQAPAPVVPPAHWTVTPFVGIAFSGDLDSGTGLIGAALGYQWSDRIGLEGEVSWLPSSENSGLIEVDSQVLHLTGNLKYQFSGDDWRPYGMVGIGYGHASVDVEDDDDVLDDLDLDTTSNEFVVDFGGGVERRISERSFFRGDLRYFFGGDFVPDFWRLSAGLTFDLGRR